MAVSKETDGMQMEGKHTSHVEDVLPPLPRRDPFVGAGALDELFYRFSPEEQLVLETYSNPAPGVEISPDLERGLEETPFPEGVNTSTIISTTERKMPDRSFRDTALAYGHYRNSRIYEKHQNARSSGLSYPEWLAFIGVAAGYHHNEIGNMLGKSERTIEVQVKAVAKKFGVENKAESIILKGIELQAIDVNDIVPLGFDFSSFDRLTPTERRTLDTIWVNPVFSARQIARVLNVPSSTLEARKSKIFAKTRLRSSRHLLACYSFYLKGEIPGQEK